MELRFSASGQRFERLDPILVALEEIFYTQTPGRIQKIDPSRGFLKSTL